MQNLMIIGVSAETGCIRYSEAFEKEKLAQLMPSDLRESDFDFVIDVMEAEMADMFLGLKIPMPKGLQWSITFEGRMDRLNYLIHTGRELDLMLEGKKPLASFSFWKDELIDGTAFDIDEIIGQPFSRYIDKGLFKHTVLVDDVSIPESLRIMICQAGEEWRFEAMNLVWKAIREIGTSPALEWLEGTLLGYTPEQNQEYLGFIARESDRDKHSDGID